MQVAEEEIKAKSRGDEELLNRPSPNFKHKKYLRSKFEEAMLVEANSSLLRHNKHGKVMTVVASAAAQPPLPPNPPPPDTPPIIMNLKQEIEDDEYKCGTTEPAPEIEQSDELKATIATIKTDESEEKPSVTMCRNFARGTCKKGATCKFAHELILSQLPGVYTFCRNFQNSVCSFPKCKFVHATVFEKEYFFRTGYLPPHTLAHLKEATVEQPPPPPPQSEEASVELPPVYSNAPPPPSMTCIPPVGVPYNGETGVEQGDPNIFRAVQSIASTTSQKREWSEIEDVSSSTRDLDSGETLAKKCKNCDSNELREQLIKVKVEKAACRNKELMQKIAQLIRKNSILAAVLGVFLMPPNTTSGTNGLHLTADKELNNLLSNNNFSSVLAKMMMNVESGLPPDVS